MCLPFVAQSVFEFDFLDDLFWKKIRKIEKCFFFKVKELSRMAAFIVLVNIGLTTTGRLARVLVYLFQFMMRIGVGGI